MLPALLIIGLNKQQRTVLYFVQGAVHFGLVIEISRLVLFHMLFLIARLCKVIRTLYSFKYRKSETQ